MLCKSIVLYMNALIQLRESYKLTDIIRGQFVISHD